MQPDVAKPFTTSTVRVCEIARGVRSTNVRRFLSVYVHLYTCASELRMLRYYATGYPTTLPVRGNFSGERTLDDDGDQHLSSRNLREESNRTRWKNFSCNRWISWKRYVVLSAPFPSLDDCILSGPIDRGGSRFCEVLINS